MNCNCNNGFMGCGNNSWWIILIIFFLPLFTAGVHVAFDFPFIFRVLNLLGLFNLKLFALCTIGCFLVFTVFYIVVYILTSRLYYRIVKK